MRVKCIANKKQAIDAQYWPDVDRWKRSDELFLTIGKSYDVFGLAIRNDRVWYLVSEEDETEYPYVHLSAFFEVEDASIPPGWVLTTRENNLGSPISILPARWAADSAFLERLVDEDPDAIAFYRELQRSGGAAPADGGQG